MNRSPSAASMTLASIFAPRSVLGGLGLALMLGALGLLVLAFSPTPVFAQDGATVTVPWGDWLVWLAGEISTVTSALVALLVSVLLRFVPGALRAFIQDYHIKAVEQLLARSVNFGLNAVQEAAIGKTLSVPVGSKVVAVAAQYAIDHGPAWLIKWLGGADKIPGMILARLNLAPDATAAQVLADVSPTRR